MVSHGFCLRYLTYLFFIYTTSVHLGRFINKKNGRFSISKETVIISSLFSLRDAMTLGKKLPYCLATLAGCALCLAFAPFKLPGMAVISLAFLYYFTLRAEHIWQSALLGFCFGLGFFGLSVSWVIISIRDYGHMPTALAFIVTLGFIAYLALYPALASVFFNALASRRTTRLTSYLNPALFAATWVLSEFLRATLLTGFPWVLIGFGQIEAPLGGILPYLGVYGAGFFVAYLAGLLFTILQARLPWKQRFPALLLFLLIQTLPAGLKEVAVTKPASQSKSALTVAIIQANMSMRDKWDEALFWELVQYYKKEIHAAIGHDLIILPESALPTPSNFIPDILSELHAKAKKNDSALIMGLLTPDELHDDFYANSMLVFGKGSGQYNKQHLVPFGEYIPAPFRLINHWLGFPDSMLSAGQRPKTLMTIKHHPIAGLICYELAYGEILRAQIPKTEWIVSISDDGWFGHSLAMYQQLQIAQVRALETDRFHLVANNDGLSSVIDNHGTIRAQLPPLESGRLFAHFKPQKTLTFWVRYGDYPTLILCLAFVILMLCWQVLPRAKERSLLAALRDKGYARQLVE